MKPFDCAAQRQAADISVCRPATRGLCRSSAGAIAVAIALLLPGCLIDRIYGDLPNAIEMTPKVIALDGLNSPYDDFNAVGAPPPLKMDALIVFASNAASRGETFGIDVGRLQLVQNPYPNRRQRQPPEALVRSTRAGAFAGIPAYGGNLRGPVALVSPEIGERDYAEPFPPYMTALHTVDREPLRWTDGGALGKGGVWMFDSDRDRRRNLYFVDETGVVRPFFGNLADADDAYASYDFERHELVFSSNRSGRWALYRVRNPERNLRFADWLGERARAARIEPLDVLNAAGNALAPYVDGDWMVFASDRPGGFGGYDLYIARHHGDGWRHPRNLQALMPLGVQVNTAANEFRPSLLNLRLKHFHDLRVLLFSSDRPGGQGGYDLYLTALPQQGAEK